MITLTRDDRDLLVRAHRWARANGWRYDATTLDGSLTDFRWRHEHGSSVVVRMDHEWPVPWELEIDGPALIGGTVDVNSVAATVGVLASLDMLPARFVRQDLAVVLRNVFGDNEIGDLLDVLFGSSETTADQLAQQPYVALVDALVKARGLKP